MGVQVLKLLVPHLHEFLEVAQIGPFYQAGRANTLLRGSDRRDRCSTRAADSSG